MAEEQKQPTDAQEVQEAQGMDARVIDMPEEEETFSIEQMEAFYDQSIASFKEGEVVQGKIVEMTDDFVLVDIGYKSEGAIPIYEFPNAPAIEIGDEFDVYIEHPEDDDGMPVLSKTKADKIKNWALIQEVYEQDGVIEGRIVRRVKGGLKVDIGVDAFMPASQLTWRPTSDLDRFIGSTMEVKIIKLTKRRRNVVVSRRKLLEEQRAGEKAKLLATIAIGQIIPGEVKNITDFGAFVDVGGIDGLLHVTDLSWGRVKHPSQVVSVGDKIEVMVLNFDPETERISLGLKQKTENPWKTASGRYPIGGVVRGRVVSMTDYGAFVQLEDGIEGMVHVSEMSWTRRVRHPNEVMNLDEDVDVMVLNVDPEAEKIALGLKQTLPNPWREIEARYPINSAVTGLVRNLTDYGAFVEIEEGIDALLHVSDISWTKKVNHPSELLERGKEIQVKILSIDPNNEKISVGLKQLESDPWQSVVERTPIGAHVEVEIAKLVSFGAFAKLENGVEGLIHVSELADERVQKPEEVLSVGDTVQAKVISIDPVDRKIGLSIREYKHDLEQGITSEYAASGSASVSIGEALGDFVPKSLLRGTLDPSQAANELLQEGGADPDPAAAPETSSETEEDSAETSGGTPTETSSETVENSAETSGDTPTETSSETEEDSTETSGDTPTETSSGDEPVESGPQED